MSESLTYQGTGAPARDQTHTLFAQTMGYVAATAGCSRSARTWPGT